MIKMTEREMEVARNAGELLYLLSTKVPRGSVTLWWNNSLNMARYEWVVSYGKRCLGVQYAVSRNFLANNDVISTISCCIIEKWVKKLLMQLPDGAKL